MRARELWYLCVSICVSLVLQGETIDCVIKTFCDKIFGKPAKGRCFPAAPPHAHYRHSLCTPGRPGKLNLHVLIKDGEIFKRTFHLNRPRLERHSCRSQAGLCSNALAFANASANAAFAFALALDSLAADTFALAFAFDSSAFAFALAFDSNAFD